MLKLGKLISHYAPSYTVYIFMQQRESENARFCYFYVGGTGVYCMNATFDFSD